MRRYIYTILFVFGTLFCQAFGVENEPLPTTTICAELGDTVRMIDYKNSIKKLLEDREKEIWSGCCDSVSVDVQGAVHIKGESFILEDWPAVEIVKKDAELTIEVTYVRRLMCTDIPQSEAAAKPGAPLAMWQLFGKLLSNIDTARATTKISDTAFITTVHKVKLKYRFGISFPEGVEFKIQGDSCFDKYPFVTLSVPEGYNEFPLKWITPKDLDFAFETADTCSKVSLEAQTTDDYLYPVICMAVSCSGDTIFDTIKIGKPTLTPEIEDLSCVAANATSFDAKVKEADERLSYHWIVEDLASGMIVDTQQGASVTMKIPQNDSVKVKLVSTGGCKASDTIESVLHRNVVADERSIYLQGDTNCLFKGDTLRLSLRNAPHEDLVWQSGESYDTLSWNSEYGVQGKDSICAVSVRSLHCPETVSKAFNIREAFKVSLDANPTCIRVNKSQVIKLSSNGINPEVRWYGNGVEIDSMAYPAKDSILLRLTNPGDSNLYVKVKAKECGRRDSATLQLRPLPEKPSLDSTWNALTPCIPLGIADTIELRVQPQDGVKFNWNPEEESGKFWRIDQSDSNSILVVTNYELEDRGRSISVSVSATVTGCGNSEPMTEVLYAAGAGLGEEWDLIQQDFCGIGYVMSFGDNGVLEEDVFIDPFNGTYSFDWFSDYVYIENPDTYNYLVFHVENPPFPFDLFCKLTNEEKQCYSVYSIEVIDMQEQQEGVFFATKQGDDARSEKEKRSQQERTAIEGKVISCPGIVLHPNPARSGVQVKVEGLCGTESFTVECHSPQGRLMFREKATGETFTFPTDSYAAGVYIVKIQRDGVSAPIVKKMIII